MLKNIKPYSLLLTGFLLSIITNIALISPFLIQIVLISYPLGCLLRSIGWILLGRITNRYFIVTGLLILILFPIICLILGSESFSQFLNLSLGQNLALILILWSTYSIFEFISYFYLAKKDNVYFYLSMVSILGIIIVFIYLPVIIQSQIIEEINLYLAQPFLLISSISSILACYSKLKKRKIKKK